MLSKSNREDPRVNALLFFQVFLAILQIFEFETTKIVIQNILHLQEVEKESNNKKNTTRPYTVIQLVRQAKMVKMAKTERNLQRWKHENVHNKRATMK